MTTQVNSRPLYNNKTLIYNCNYTDGVYHVLELYVLSLFLFIDLFV